MRTDNRIALPCGADTVSRLRATLFRQRLQKWRAVDKISLVRREFVWRQIVAFLCGAAVALSSLVVLPETAADPFLSRLALIDEVLERIRSDFVRQVKFQNLVYGMVRGMVQQLDPYCDFKGAEEAQKYLASLKGEYCGVGIEVTMEGGYLTVLAPIEGSPAYEAGLMPGDRIVRVNGEPIRGLSFLAAIRRLKGKRGTKVEIEVLRAGVNHPLSFTLTRKEIKAPSVSDAQMIDTVARIGYVRIRRFQKGTAKELEKVLAPLLKEGMEGLVMDLRGNPGGTLDDALNVADLFVSKGALLHEIGRQEGHTFKKTYTAKPGDPFEGLTLAVLVDRGTASAAEVVAGALQDAGVAILVGERTFGKGCVQSVFRLQTEPALLKLTTALWFTPNGHAVQKGVLCLHKGACFHRQNEQDRLRGGLAPNEPVSLSATEVMLLRQLRLRSPKQTWLILQFDRQLRRAVSILKNRKLFEEKRDRVGQF